jgi:soluble cytochrome b562
MKIRLILTGSALCLALPVLAADKKETPLGRQMEATNDALKAIKKETDPAKGAAQAREAQQAILKSIAEMPGIVGQMPDGVEKAKAYAEYRKMLAKVYVAFCEIEEAFLSGKTDQVAGIMATLKDLKKAGHDKFMEEEE